MTTVRSPPSRNVSLGTGDYDGGRLLTSPRSLEACFRLGIDPSELLTKPHNLFFAGGVSRSVAEMKIQHFETQRFELVQLATEERRRALQEDNEALNNNNSATSPTSPTISYRSVGSTPRTSMTPGRGARSLRSPEDAAASSLRIRSIQEQDEMRRSHLQQKTEASLASAHTRRLQHIDATSQQVDVRERVAAARYRWMRNEHALVQRHTEQATYKMLRIDAQREATKDKAHINLIQATEAKEMKIAEAKDRSQQMQESRKLRLEHTIEEGEKKCVAAVQRVETRRAHEAAQRRLKFDEITTHAAQLKTAMDEKRQADAIHLEQVLDEKRAKVEERHRQIQSAQQHKFAVRRHYFEHGEKVQQDIRSTQQRLAQQRETDRTERMRAAAVERDMIIEAKREDEEDKRMRCLRARRALDYAHSKRKIALAAAGSSPHDPDALVSSSPNRSY